MIKAAGLQPATLPKTKLPQKYFSRTPLTSQKHLSFKEHLTVSASDDIRTIKILVLYCDTNFLFLGYLMILIACAHTALIHFSISCFDEFFKHFKCFCELNINRKRIPNFWSNRSKNCCAKFVVVCSGHNEIILMMRSFQS